MVLSLVMAAAPNAPHSPSIRPDFVGGGVLIVFLIMLLGLLAFGKGREHS